MSCSSRSISWGWPACRAEYLTTRCSSPTGTWCRRSAASCLGHRRSCSSSWLSSACAAARRRPPRFGRERIPPASSGPCRHRRRITASPRLPRSDERNRIRGQGSLAAQTPRPQWRLGIGGIGAGFLFWNHRAADSSPPLLLDPAGPTKRANRKLVRALLIMTAGRFVFGWALVPLYDVLCRAAGIGNAEAKDGKSAAREAIDPNREVTIEFLAESASVGSFEVRPKVASMRIHPGKLYDAQFHARNLTAQASVAQAVPSISPTGTARYFHKTECFCF